MLYLFTSHSAIPMGKMTGKNSVLGLTLKIRSEVNTGLEDLKHFDL
jgi:hypothetical protein